MLKICADTDRRFNYQATFENFGHFSDGLFRYPFISRLTECNNNSKSGGYNGEFTLITSTDSLLSCQVVTTPTDSCAKV